MERIPLALLLSVAMSVLASAQTAPQPTPTGSPLVEVSYGEYVFPKFLFSFADGLKKNPGNLFGKSYSVDIRKPVTKTVSIGFQFSHEIASNVGDYLTDEAITQALENGATLTSVIGPNKFRIRTYVGDVEKIFPLKHGRIPFIKGGFGRGVLTDLFNGQANLNIPGGGIMSQPATDHSSYGIWAVSFDAGMKFRLAPGLSAVVAGHWNTGIGIRAGIEKTLPTDRIGSTFRKLF